MVFRVFSTTLPIALLAQWTVNVDAHGYLVKPTADFLSGTGDYTQYSATFYGTKAYPDGTFNGAPADNVASFITQFEAGSYATIKALVEANQELVSGATSDCGFTDTTQNTNTLESSVWWGKNTDLTGEGFVTSHEGPCESWCDDVMVQQEMNCVTAYNPSSGSGAAEVPIDSSSCSGASRFTFYWIAMHSEVWQVYLNCLALDGSTSSSTTTSTTSTTSSSSSTPTTTTASPTTTTAAPTTTTATPTTTTSTPSTTTAASTTTTSPSTSTTNSTSSGTASSNNARGNNQFSNGVTFGGGSNTYSAGSVQPGNWGMH